MKLRLISLALVLVVCLACAGTAAGQVYAARDNVSLTPTTLFGDEAAAHGARVHLQTTYDQRLFWDSVHTPGGDTDTAYRYSSERIYTDRLFPHDPITMMTETDAGIYAVHGMLSAEGPLASAYESLFANLAPGTEGEREIYLKDYYEYYPLSISLELPGTSAWLAASEEIDYEPDPNGPEYALLQLRNYFRIPVLEGETLVLSAGKNESGNVANYGSNSTDSDAFYMNLISTLTDRACYFTFNTKTQEGHIVDTSCLPEGYGIYALPYEQGRKSADGYDIISAKIDEFGLCYPLEPGISVLFLHTDEAQQNLLLHTIEGDGCYLTVIDIATMQQRQKLLVHAWDEEQFGWQLCDEGDFLVLFATREDLVSVIERTEDGLYQVAFTCPVRGDDSLPWFSLAEPALAYNGEKLLLAGYPYDDAFGFRDTCNVFLAVYDQTGMLYYGEYKNSLDVGLAADRYDFHLRAGEMLTVAWE